MYYAAIISKGLTGTYTCKMKALEKERPMRLKTICREVDTECWRTVKKLTQQIGDILINSEINSRTHGPEFWRNDPIGQFCPLKALTVALSQLCPLGTLTTALGQITPLDDNDGTLSSYPAGR